MTPLVSTHWLADRLKEPDLRIVDAGWYMSADQGSGRADYEREHIPGAVYFDIDLIADLKSDLPHMLAAPSPFAVAVSALGINFNDRIVVYDHAGLFSAARVWWNFRAMGHTEVFVLDGGLPRWKADGHPVTDEAPTAARQPFIVTPNPALVRTLPQVREALAAGAQVVDARAAGRFCGQDPEPRAGLRSGHMPGAVNLPWSQIVKDGALLPPDQLQAAFKGAGLDLDKPIITTCGSGVSAAILSLALAQIGHPDSAVYDGSWSEWGGRDDTEVVVD